MVKYEKKCEKIALLFFLIYICTVNFKYVLFMKKSFFLFFLGLLVGAVVLYFGKSHPNEYQFGRYAGYVVMVMLFVSSVFLRRKQLKQ